MKLEVVLQTLVEGRTNQVPSDELASSVSMQPVELEIFEENIRREFLAKYNVYYNLDAVAENLGWPVELTDRLASTYGLVREEGCLRRMVRKKTREFFARKVRRVPVSRTLVANVLHAYFSIKKNSLNVSDVSVKEVEKISEKKYEQCRYVLQEAGLPFAVHRAKITESEKAAIKSSLFTKKDISAFTGISMVTLARYAPEFSFPNDRNTYLFLCGPALDSWSRLQYRDASQIYEAADSGLPLEMIHRFVKKHPKAIRHAISNRATIGQPIISFLRDFYGLPGHNKPYKTSTMKTMGSASKV